MQITGIFVYRHCWVSAFLGTNVVCNCCRCVPLHVSQERAWLAILRPDDHMYVARHNAPAIELHSLLSPAMVKAHGHLLEVFIPDKYIDPIHPDSYRDKVKAFLVVKLVFPAHWDRKWKMVKNADCHHRYFGC